MKRTLLFIIFLSAIIICQAQQRPVISTYMFNGLALNPAYAGSLNVLSATFIYRKQWINVEGAPTSQLFSVHNSFLSNQVGIGLMATRDKIGVHEESAFYGSYAYKIRTSSGILTLGISGGFDNRRSYFNMLNLINEDDRILQDVPSRFNPNFGTGVYFANPKMYLGVSVPYIIENKLYEVEGVVTESRESRYYYGTGGVVLDLNEQIKFSPSFLVRYQQKSRLGWDLNAMIIFDEIAYVGASYRNGDALVFLVQMILNENFRLGYSYDATTSALTNHSRGTHEILFNYRIKLKNYKHDPQCPVYF